MTKILKIKVKRESKPGGVTHYVYPAEYDAELIEVTCYEFASNTTNPGARTYEYCIGVVSDKDAAEFLKSEDITEITEAQALTDGRVWRLQSERITDPDAVIAVCKKIIAGTELTKKEKNAIDPENAESGVGKTTSYDTILTRSMAKRS